MCDESVWDDEQTAVILIKRLLAVGWKWSGSVGTSIFLALSTRDVEMAVETTGIFI